MQLNVRSFFGAYQAYCQTNRMTADIFGIDEELRHDFEDAVFYPKGLDEVSFLAHYLGEPDNQLANLVNSVFNSIPLSHIYKTLVDGFDMKPDFHLKSDNAKKLEMSLHHSDDFITFSAVRTFDAHKRKVIHNSCGALCPQTRKPMHSGYGSRFLFNSLAVYDQIGVTQIDIPEAVKAGVEAWPKMGFVFDVDFFDAEVFDLVSNYIENEREMSSQKASYIESLLEDGAEFGVKLFEEDPELFSEIMREIEAQATKIAYTANLQDNEQRARFNMYFAEKGVRSSQPVKQKFRLYG